MLKVYAILIDGGAARIIIFMLTIKKELSYISLETYLLTI